MTYPLIIAKTLAWIAAVHIPLDLASQPLPVMPPCKLNRSQTDRKTLDYKKKTDSQLMWVNTSHTCIAIN